MSPTPTTPAGFLYIGFASAACGSLLLYDALLTLVLEAELVWRERWTLSKVLYSLCRYMFIVILFINVHIYTMVNPSEKLCDIWQNVWLGWACVCSAAIPDGLILLRLDVLYRERPRIRYLTMVVFTVHVLALVFVILANNVFEPRIPVAVMVPIGCNLTMFGRKLKVQDFLSLVPVLAQIYYFTITVAQFLSSAKEIRRATNDSFTRSVFSMRDSLPTYFIILRQGTCYFLGTIFAYTLVLALDFIDPYNDYQLPGVPVWITINSLLGSRLYLMMRSHGKVQNNGNSTRLRAMSFRIGTAVS